jgi:hypothetical protein
MGSRTHHSTNPRPTLPEPTGPHDERFVYGLTAAGRRALEQQRRADAGGAGGRPVAASVAEKPPQENVGHRVGSDRGKTGLARAKVRPDRPALRG